MATAHYSLTINDGNMDGLDVKVEPDVKVESDVKVKPDVNFVSDALKDREAIKVLAAVRTGVRLFPLSSPQKGTNLGLTDPSPLRIPTSNLPG